MESYFDIISSIFFFVKKKENLFRPVPSRVIPSHKPISVQQPDPLPLNSIIL